MAQRLSNRTWVTCRPGSGARTAEVGSAAELAAVFLRLKQVLGTDLSASPHLARLGTALTDLLNDGAATTVA
ncbi:MULTISPECIES: hypothetical protein [unclassified Mesorhizobium]|uniref:hypothetical protein n=1 Tax=unclassified Mesorhizobium TaxID=325217 RepID=UPI00112928EA|nr:MULTISPECIES: hypothetical protein [unclassified Mesorhizobium]MCA0025259.1 hypothetical protein [Mesorhizobium sp. B263B1A]TPJ50569.1 hypothetical protein FJ426_24240 [Mesorhizobium sp. B2-6-4]TPJ58099.1 hypothetical protein FJ443_27680 [Mesorhizobium sp. B2-6-1]TPJ91321.1 hypothetical protein FJ489_25095 [Mesorhizobium sp. B2-5-12]TPK20968.1 hypothetical protein FJ562_26605 [Mesorhizobium sp. B2-5-6]